MKKVQVEVFPLLTKGLGDGNSERVLLEECLENDKLFSDLVNQVVTKHPALGQAILDPKSQQLREEITIFINNCLLHLPSGSSTKLEDGDRVFFLMTLSGG